jgi:hypothetical protein
MDSQSTREPKRQKTRHIAIENDDGNFSKSILGRFSLVSKRARPENPTITAQPVAADAVIKRGILSKKILMRADIRKFKHFNQYSLCNFSFKGGNHEV